MNLSTEQLAALHNLSTNQEIVIKPSDKRENVVLMDIGQYIQMCLCILENCEWYKLIPEHVATRFWEEFFLILLEEHQTGIINKETYESIFVKFPTFYAVPKTHKDIRCLPCRPIMSGMGSYAERASQLVNTYLRPHIVVLPSYMQYTTYLWLICDRKLS